MKYVLFFLEKQAFGVCSRLGEMLGVSSAVIRLYFIYTSFLTLGSPVLIYLFLAFWINFRRYVRKSISLQD
ncbi:MAG: PspC domain-containing protein [Cytophagales bacterium]|nr:PspC domain-containing protein [Cytophagales bacterium]MDW8384418.1 PspC domain-containing protein [Flammeovirgaceae bacterium]